MAYRFKSGALEAFLLAPETLTTKTLTLGKQEREDTKVLRQIRYQIIANYFARKRTKLAFGESSQKKKG